MNLECLKPFTSQTGQIIRFSEIFICRANGEIKYAYKEFPVLLSNQENLVYLNKYGKLAFLDQKKRKKREGYNSHWILNDVHIYEQNYNIRYFESENGLYAHCFSFQSKKINDRRVKTALQKYLDKEFNWFSGAKSALLAFQIQ